MATCNLFINNLTKETGTFLTFSQYVEDITKHSGAGETYKVIPSSFMSFDINYSKTSSDFLIQLQNKFENGCAKCKNKLGKEWNPEYSKNLFWNAFTEIFKSDINNTNNTEFHYPHVYEGKISFQSGDVIDGTSYSDIYCHIPNDGVCQTLTTKIEVSGEAIESGKNLEGYTDKTLQQSIIYYPESNISFNWTKETIDKFNII